VYVLSRILHDWPDPDAVAILRRCRAAMSNGARLCVLEQIAPDSAGVSQTEQFDLAIKEPEHARPCRRPRAETV